MSAERQRVLELVREHGFNATSFQTLETGYAYFFFGEGCVAYVDTGAAWVAAGAPIAARGAIAELLRAFLAAAHAAGRRACFFATEQRLHDICGTMLGALRLGEQPVLVASVVLSGARRAQIAVRQGEPKLSNA